MEITCGLDFGTSNSAIAVGDERGVKSLEIDDFNNNKTTIKSILYYDEEDRIFYFGQRAVDVYIENDACGRYMQSIKTYLKDKTFVRTTIGSKSFTLEELIAKILGNIKSQAEKSIGKQIANVVLGRPVVFSSDTSIDAFAEKRLISAAKIAGFRNVFLQLEPVAAAISCESFLREKQEKVMLVGAFGAGTSDFTIMKVDPTNTIFQDRSHDILATSGVYIGGDTFDSQIMWEKIAKYFGRFTKIHTMTSKISGGPERDEFPVSILRKLCKWHLIPQLKTPQIRQYLTELKYLTEDKSSIVNIETLIDDNYGYMLFRAIELAKCKLSTYNAAHIVFNENNLSIHEELLLAELERMLKQAVVQLNNCMEETLQLAGLRKTDVDIIFLTGGTSHIPCIRNIFTSGFTNASIYNGDAFTSVAHGLGIQSAMYR